MLRVCAASGAGPASRAPLSNRLKPASFVAARRYFSSPVSFATTRSSGLTPRYTYQPRQRDVSPLVHCFFHQPTSTWTYLAVCPTTKETLVIDSVLDFDLESGNTSTESVEGLKAFIAGQGYAIKSIMETHVHADHLTGAAALRKSLGEQVPIMIGERVKEVQKTFAPVYGFQLGNLVDSFDAFMRDGGTSTLGKLRTRYFNLPGHTPDSMGILVGDSLFAGDSIFLPDVGTARVDFPGGSASELYASIQKILELNGDVRIFSGHDYPDSREPSCMSLVSEQKLSNKHVGTGTKNTLETFVKCRENRDATLGAPTLLHPSLRVNLRGGRLPPPDEAGLLMSA